MSLGVAVQRIMAEKGAMHAASTTNTALHVPKYWVRRVPHTNPEANPTGRQTNRVARERERRGGGAVSSMMGAAREMNGPHPMPVRSLHMRRTGKEGARAVPRAPRMKMEEPMAMTRKALNFWTSLAAVGADTANPHMVIAYMSPDCVMEMSKVWRMLPVAEPVIELEETTPLSPNSKSVLQHIMSSKVDGENILIGLFRKTKFVLLIKFAKIKRSTLYMENKNGCVIWIQLYAKYYVYIKNQI